jgi:hypothetical protein
MSYLYSFVADGALFRFGVSGSSFRKLPGWPDADGFHFAGRSKEPLPASFGVYWSLS